MKKIIISILFIIIILLGKDMAYAQKSSPTETTCQPSVEEILSAVKAAYGFSPSTKGVWVAGEIQGGWGELRIPEEKLSMLQILAMLGGVLKTANGSVYIIQQPAEGKAEIKQKFDVKDIKQGLIKDIKLEKGSLMFVSRGCIDEKLLQPTKMEIPRVIGTPSGGSVDSPMQKTTNVRVT